MAIVKHEYIQNRADFFVLLDQVIADTARLRGGQPFAPLDSVLIQLEAIKKWTANGRNPAVDERSSLAIGQIIARELEPAANDDLYVYTQKLSEVSFYFELWWDDSMWANMDDNDPRTDFPFDADVWAHPEDYR